MKTLFIFRRDLRTYDNTTLNQIISKNPKMEILSKCKLYTTYNFMEGNKDNELVMFARRYKCKGENFEYADRERILYDRLFK